MPEPWASSRDIPVCAELDLLFQEGVAIRGLDISRLAPLAPVENSGGHGCVNRIRTALVQALDRRGVDGESCVPWYFPTTEDYATRLERAGFRVNSIGLIPRPTPLPGDIIAYLETFGQSFLAGLSGQSRDEYLEEVRAMLEPQLLNSDGVWVAAFGFRRRRRRFRQPAPD
jgi:hypothetical protein